MYIRKTLARLLITAMIAGSVCSPVLADEIEISTPQQTAMSVQAETEFENDLPADIVVETEAETAAETEITETAETVSETEAALPEAEEAVLETETEISVAEESASEPEADGITADIPSETESDVPAEAETETAFETEEVISDEDVLLDAVTPRAATSFKAAAGDTYVTLSWKKGTDAKGYRIEMQDTSANSTSWVIATEKTSYKVTGLKPECSYKFRLLAWTGSSPNFTFGEYTNWITAKTTLFTPETPTDLTATVSDTSATVSWKASNYAQKYRLRVYDNQTKTSFWGAFTASTSATVTDLDKTHTYKFRVQAYRNAAGTYTYSNYTDWVTPGTSAPTVTLAASSSVITPGAPANLNVTSGDKAATLTWTAGKSAHKYRVRIYDCVTKKSSWAAFTAATSVTIAGLDNNHSYKFRVQAYRNNKGVYTFSSYTPWVAVTVTPLSASEAIGWNNSVILEWPEVSGATQYKIYSVNLSTGERTWVRSLGSNHLEYRLTGLKNGSTYAYQIYVYKNGSVYAYSPVVKATAAEPRAKYVSTALKYLGVTEGSALHKEIIDIYNSQNPVPVGYKMTYTDPWCAAFATAMAVKANVIRMIPGECSCTRQIALWKKLGYYVSDPGANKKYTPSVGDLVYYSWTKNASSPDHVGIVTKVTSTTLTVIEGNKGNAVSERVINDYKHYGYIIGYGKPNGN